MKEEIVFVLLPGFADWEGAPLAAELAQPETEHPAFEVRYASLSREPIRSIGGLTVLPDLALHEIPVDAKALVLVGGTSWKTPEAEAVAPVVRQFLEAGKVVGAICDAAHFLGAQGLLNQHRHTANMKQVLEGEAGYQNPEGFVPEDAVRQEPSHRQRPGPLPLCPGDAPGPGSFRGSGAVLVRFPDPGSKSSPGQILPGGLIEGVKDIGKE